MDYRELDRKVAEALGWKPTVGDLLVHTSGAVIDKHVVPWYSSDIADAMMALEEFAGDDAWVISAMMHKDRDTGYTCIIWPNGINESFGRGDTIAVAICNAILAASKAGEVRG